MKIYTHFNDLFESAKLADFLKQAGHEVTPASGEASLQLMDGYFDTALIHGYYHKNNITADNMIAAIRNMDEKLPIIVYSFCEDEAHSIKDKYENIHIYHTEEEFRRGLASLNAPAQPTVPPEYVDRLIPEFIL